MDIDCGVMSVDEFWPELRQTNLFKGLLKDFSIREEDFSNAISEWVVIYDGELPDHIDGYTSDNTIRINPETEDFNKLLTFIHELTHACQYITGVNKVQFRSDSSKIEDVEELKEYLNDKGERQAAKAQVQYLCDDEKLDKDKTWVYMRAGWGIKPDTKPEVLSVVQEYFDKLWDEVTGES